MTPPFVIGWRERADFVDWDIAGVRVKIDTGARTSAIDADVLELRPNSAGGSTVVFAFRRGRRRPGNAKVIESPLVGTTRVRSSNGDAVERYLIATTIRLGPVQRQIHLSIADRGRMLVPVILGRTALANDFLVDVSRKYVWVA
jgi:hypothetical protein